MTTLPDVLTSFAGRPPRNGASTAVGVGAATPGAAFGGAHARAK